MIGTSKLVNIACPKLPQVVSRLNQLNGNAPKAVTRGLYGWAEQTRTAAIEVTPKNLGELRDSIHVPVPSPDECKVSIVAGGPAAPYAVRQHEKLFDNYTTPGTGPKYLENPINERMPKLSEDISRELDKEIGKVSQG